jgi:hypothetical protein
LQRKRENEYFKIKTNNYSISDRSKIIGNIYEQKIKLGKESQLGAFNYEKNICQKSFDESFSNSNKNHKIQIKENISKGNSLNKSPIKNDSFTKLKYFNVKKDIFKKVEKFSFEQSNNNEINVLKNNKKVYINSFLLNSHSTSRAIKKLKKNNFVIRKERSSKYRGVSKNGNKWQVIRNKLKLIKFRQKYNSYN